MKCADMLCAPEALNKAEMRRDFLKLRLFSFCQSEQMANLYPCVRTDKSTTPES